MLLCYYATILYYDYTTTLYYGEIWIYNKEVSEMKIVYNLKGSPSCRT